MKKLKKYFKGNIKYAILAPICIIIDTLGMIVQPYFISKIIDVGISNGDINYIIKMGIIMILLCIVSVLGGIFAMFFSSKAAYGFGANIRQDMINKIQEFSFFNINKFTTSSLVTRLTNDVEILVNLVQMMLRMFIRSPFMLVGGVFMMLTVNKKVSLIFVAIIPVLAILITFVIKKAFPLFKKVQIKIDKVNSIIRENLIGARVIKSFVREEYEIDRFNKANNDLKDTYINSFRLLVILVPAITLIMNLSIAAVLWISAGLVQSADLEVGAISASITYISLTLMSLVMLSMVFMNFSRSKASYERIMEVLEEPPDIKDNNTKSIYKIQKGLIKYDIESFSFADSEGESILKNIKFTIEPGEKVAIIGSTGTGKSTLLNLLPRFYDVTEGSVKIDGINVKDFNLKTLRDNIGIVPQENRLFSGTIEENIMWGKKEATIDEIKKTCEIAQIDSFIEQLPDKYQTKISQRGTNLSGGQKQRIAIARALIKNPKILILDDSVSALDATTEANLKKALNKNYKDTTIIFVVQKISSCKDCDKVIVIDEGTIVGIGTHEDLIKDNKIYQEIARSQNKVIS